MNINRIFKQIAKKNNTSVHAVRREIQAAIDQGMANPDPAVRAYWNAVPHRGEKPTPEEAVAYFSAQAANRANLRFPKS